ncbi:C-type lectin domain family 4 member C isoform X2 [Parambassis ranga]|uniref:C-type lectin domain family 4 member C isoform X2 n=1 Tax=Parambassis ranga TaxID=210632 RepID=A0A6P7JU17_9TELE|nr:C-type lectin domain family 4 member C-like isoform X2 [Parambassis ranga]
MELQEIPTETERKEDYEGAGELMMEAKTEEEAEPDHYAKLRNPSEDVYSETYYSGASVKTTAGKQTVGNVRLYRAACFFLTAICLVLLVAILVLSMKFQAVSTACSEREETTPADRHGPSPTCSYDDCQALFPNTQSEHVGCQQCAKGWLKFSRSCFYLSTFRLSWDEGQRNCSSRGGSLAVITSHSLQSFLTKKGKLKYWIGLRQNGGTWTWVNNNALQHSYWEEPPENGDCGIINSDSPPETSWMRASCQASTYFICQLQL